MASQRGYPTVARVGGRGALGTWEEIIQASFCHTNFASENNIAGLFPGSPGAPPQGSHKSTFVEFPPRGSRAAYSFAKC